MTEDLVRFFNARLGRNLTPIFDQYLRRAALPVLELAFNEKEGTVAYRWKADEREFAMPIRVGRRGQWQVIQPDGRLGDDDDGRAEGGVRGGDRSLLRQRGEAVQSRGRRIPCDVSWRVRRR